MQIEVVDDCSDTDEIERVVAEVGRGRVGYFRQEQNVGHTRNFNTCIARAKGELVHILHGDDRVRQGFYEKMEALFRQHAHMGAAYCRFITMQEDGQWIDFQDLLQQKSGILQDFWYSIAKKDFLRHSAMVVKREVYEKVGGYDERLRYGEDWEMWVRIAASYPIGYETQPLAEYREQACSISSKLVSTGEDTHQLSMAVRLASKHLPLSSKQTIRRTALTIFANNALNKAIGQYKLHRNIGGFFAQSREALKMQSTIQFLAYMLKVYTGAFLRSLR
jgi:glycosyltransferase involved in cell wall biosynthesis